MTELTDRVRAGGIEHFALLYRQHIASARTYARMLVRTHDVDDVVSDAFDRILRALLRGSGPSDQTFRAYLCTTIRSRAAHTYRQRRREELEAELELQNAQADPMLIVVGENAVRQDNIIKRIRAVRRLPIRWRVVVWLLDIENVPLAQVAELLGTTPNNVSALAYRARTRLRRNLNNAAKG